MTHDCVDPLIPKRMPIMPKIPLKTGSLQVRTSDIVWFVVLCITFVGCVWVLSSTAQRAQPTHPVPMTATKNLSVLAATAANSAGHTQEWLGRDRRRTVPPQ